MKPGGTVPGGIFFSSISLTGKAFAGTFVSISIRTMNKRRSSLLRGTLDLLILKSLVLEPKHGVGISRRIQQMTQDSISVGYGSLFPALHRMEERGWLKSEWKASELNRQAKYYQLTKAGRQQIKIEVQEWDRVVRALSLIIHAE